MHVEFFPAFFRGRNDIGCSESAQVIRKHENSALEDLRSKRAEPAYLKVLSPQAYFLVKAKWENDCEEMFEVLAEQFPEDLLRLLANDVLPPSALTFAAEIAGRIQDSEKVQSCLKPLLAHRSPLVREGAIYGLCNHFDDSVEALFRELAGKDPSLAIRQAASDALGELCGNP
jgi:HEAT repeat protein